MASCRSRQCRDLLSKTPGKTGLSSPRYAFSIRPPLVALVFQPLVKKSAGKQDSAPDPFARDLPLGRPGIKGVLPDAEDMADLVGPHYRVLLISRLLSLVVWLPGVRTMRTGNGFSLLGISHCFFLAGLERCFFSSLTTLSVILSLAVSTISLTSSLVALERIFS